MPSRTKKKEARDRYIRKLDRYLNPPPPEPEAPPAPALPPVKYPDSSDPNWDIERACTAVRGLHVPQYELVLSARSDTRIVCDAGRQSGKSSAVAVVLLDNALHFPNAVCLYLGLSATQAERQVWRSIQQIITRLNLTTSKISSVQHSISFPNGSTIYLLGTDDRRTIESFRGGTYQCVVLDEFKSQSYNDVREWVEEIIEPGLIATNGPLVLIGTPPSKKEGYFANVRFGGGFKVYHWDGRDNTFLPEGFFDLAVERACKSRNVTIDDTRIQREFFGQWLEDTATNVFYYDPKINGYDPAVTAPPKGIWRYWIGIDPGSNDALAIILIGNPIGTNQLWHLDEFVTAKGHDSPTSVLAGHVKRMFDKWNGGKPIPVWMDPIGGASPTTLLQDYGIHALSAIKVAKNSQIERCNDLLTSGRMRVILDSKLARDLTKTEWAVTRNQAGNRQYSKVWKQDAADALRYAIGGWFAVNPPPKKEKLAGPTRMAREAEKAFKESFKKQPPQQPNRDATALWGKAR